MNRQILLAFVLCAASSVVFSTPVQQNPYQPINYDNVPRCLQPAVSGRCLAFFPSYYYNPGKKTCEQFIYGGCGGNQNRFFTFEECMAECEGAEPEHQDFNLIVPTETIDPCTLPSETGPCRAGMPRFYFNGDKCESFLYGGCEGNENNFKTIEECEQKCSPKSSEGSEEVEPTSENKSEEVTEAQPQSEEDEKNE